MKARDYVSTAAFVGLKARDYIWTRLHLDGGGDLAVNAFLALLV